MTGHTKRTTISIPVILTVCFACILSATGCQRTLRIPKLGGIYRNSANYNGPDRNPVIVIPGILGSRLTDPVSGKVVWGAFSGDYANPETDDGARLLALPMKQGLPLEQLYDNVTPQGALDRLKIGIIGIPLSLNAYANILATLGAGGFQDQQLSEADAIDYGDDHFTCFQFSYDWRRDNVENAQRLHEYIQEKKDFVEAQYRQRFNIENPQVRFDLVAHSMGGLATRYFLRYGDADLPADGSKPDVTWAGARDVERVILIGHPMLEPSTV